MEERIENWIVLGRSIGSATRCYRAKVCFIQLNDFIPYPNVDLPACSCLGINYESGLFIGYNDKGGIVYERDMLEVVRMVPQFQPEVFAD
ncbi:MAG: hypothetical protein NTZ20_05220 [Candidatus Levybacteria bacterium]|nr:hypothetical protein [Candidatus Levybacteria bacterium]